MTLQLATAEVLAYDHLMVQSQFSQRRSSKVDGVPEESGRLLQVLPNSLKIFQSSPQTYVKFSANFGGPWWSLADHVGFINK